MPHRKRFSPPLSALLAGLMGLLATGAMLVNFHFAMTRQAEDSMCHPLPFFMQASACCCAAIHPSPRSLSADLREEGINPP